LAAGKRERKCELAAKLGRAGSEMGTVALGLHQTIADRLGLNPADHKCLDVLCRAPDPTAGDLADWTGLTTGAVTALIDRLERGGFVRREAHPTDRRKVVVRVIPEKMAEVQRLFQPLGEAMNALCSGYSETELETIVDYLTRAAALFRQEARRLRHESAEPPPAF